MEMKQIKKALLQEKIRITLHAKNSLEKRGYTSSDIISCIWGGELTKTQFFQQKVRVIVEGKDMDDLPIVLVIGKDDSNPTQLAIVSVYPPINKKFKRVI